MDLAPAGISSLLNAMYFNWDSSHIRETKTVVPASVYITRSPELSNSNRTIEVGELDILPENAMIPYFNSHSKGTEADRTTMAARNPPSNPGSSIVIESMVDLDDFKTSIHFDVSISREQ